MKKICTVLLFIVGFLSATYAIAQVYNGMHDAVVEPMDRVAEQHNAVYANVGPAGEIEEAMGQEERYTNMMEPMDNVIDQHFNIITNHQTVEEATTVVK
jgi:uncharacterized ion transporter superfamily protein YfcC